MTSGEIQSFYTSGRQSSILQQHWQSSRAQWKEQLRGSQKTKRKSQTTAHRWGKARSITSRGRARFRVVAKWRISSKWITPLLPKSENHLIWREMLPMPRQLRHLRSGQIRDQEEQSNLGWPSNRQMCWSLRGQWQANHSTPRPAFLTLQHRTRSDYRRKNHHQESFRQAQLRPSRYHQSHRQLHRGRIPGLRLNRGRI